MDSKADDGDSRLPLERFERVLLPSREKGSPRRRLRRQLRWRGEAGVRGWEVRFVVADGAISSKPCPQGAFKAQLDIQSIVINCARSH
jgi:hypothetical protein